MLTRHSITALLALSAGVLAQDTTVTVDATASCSELEPVTDTVTAAVTITTCPACTGMATSNAPPPPPQSTIHTTVYTTVYVDICSTGLTSKTYTVTESCTGSTQSFASQTSGYVPPGFTTTVTVCTVCNHQNTPTTVTLTVPCTSTGGGSGPGPALSTSATIPPMSGSNGGGSSMPPPTGEPVETDTATITETCHECPKTTAGGTGGTGGSSTNDGGSQQYTPGPNAASSIIPISLGWSAVWCLVAGIFGAAFFL